MKAGRQRVRPRAVRTSGTSLTTADLLRLAEGTMGGLLEAAPDAMIVSDAEGRIVLINRQAEHLFGYVRSALLGATVDRLLPNPSDLTRARRKDGSEFPVEISSSSVSTAGGRLVTSVVRDVSARLRDSERQRFLTVAGAALASSLDYEETLRRVASCAVPHMATWCVVDLRTDEGVEPVAVSHHEPSKEALVYELRARYPFDPEAPFGLPAVLRTGQAALYSRVQQEWRAAAARDARHLALMDDLDAHSSMCVPLLAHGRVLGAITLVSADAGRSYEEADLALLEELARRAAIAIENARLYRDAQIARTTAERVREEVEETNARLEAILTVTDAALAHLPMATLLRELLIRVRDLLRVDTAAVLWLSDDEREFLVQAALGLEHETEHAVRVPVDQGLTARIAAERDALIVDDVSDAEPLLSEAGVKSLLGVALLTEGRVRGVLHIGSAMPRRFSADEARLLRLVGDRIALAINQSRLYEAERAERQRAERLAAEWQTTLGQIADGVLIADPTGQISFMNEAARELFGETSGAPRRAESLPIANTGESVFDETPLGRALRYGETVRNTEVSIRRADGSEVLAIGSAAPVVAEDGTRLGAVRTFHDVTAQRELERQREEFFANASHDLRTPVATIKTSIEVLLQNEPPGTSAVLHRLLTNIDREADRMATLVNDLLELSRLRSGRSPLQIQSVDLRAVAAHVRDGIAPLAERRRQRLELALPKRPVFAAIDAPRLERALLNLLANAQKYGYEGGLVRLTLVRRGARAVFSVIDDGPGIRSADHGRIFERFYRAETAATRRNQGSGLGLPIARATAELHGGQLVVATTPGGGATFSLSLPLSRHP